MLQAKDDDVSAQSEARNVTTEDNEVKASFFSGTKVINTDYEEVLAVPRFQCANRRHRKEKNK